jgi:hypothetical protein
MLWRTLRLKAFYREGREEERGRCGHQARTLGFSLIFNRYN